MSSFQLNDHTIEVPDELIAVFGEAKTIENAVVLGSSSNRSKEHVSWVFRDVDYSNRITFCGEIGRLVTRRNESHLFAFYIIRKLFNKQDIDGFLRFKNYCELLADNIPCFLEDDPDILFAVSHNDIMLHFNSDTLAAYLTLLEKPQ